MTWADGAGSSRGVPGFQAMDKTVPRFPVATAEQQLSDETAE